LSIAAFCLFPISSNSSTVNAIFAACAAVIFRVTASAFAFASSAVSAERSSGREAKKSSSPPSSPPPSPPSRRPSPPSPAAFASAFSRAAANSARRASTAALRLDLAEPRVVLDDFELLDGHSARGGFALEELVALA
jgi:hypothetical protein